MQELANHYASKEMRDLWSTNNKYHTWRRVWVALAEAQWQVGLDRILPHQIEALREHIGSYDEAQFHRLAELERECKHDVVAHFRLLGELAPEAKDIIHLGATSCDITDNADLVIIRDGLNLILHRLVGAISSLAVVAEIFRDYPCLAYTHYQPAQLTTIGKRTCMWLADFISDLRELEGRISGLKLRGLKGATGTQDSYFKLFGGMSSHLVYDMERYFAEKFGFAKVYKITGQTYSRKVDSQILSALSGIGQTAHKFGTDMRLLQHDYEMQEEFSDRQVGSSAMPYKRNPMRCERMCSLARYLVNEAHNAELTHMTQWLERSLDDSAGRRVYLPGCFLAADAVLRLVIDVANGIYVNKDVIETRVRKEMPFVLTEPLLVEAVKAGGDRTSMHAVLRNLCKEATDWVRSGRANPLWVELDKRPAFKAILPRLDKEPGHYIGLAADQVRDFIADEYMPLTKKYRKSINQEASLDV